MVFLIHFPNLPNSLWFLTIISSDFFSWMSVRISGSNFWQCKSVDQCICKVDCFLSSAFLCIYQQRISFSFVTYPHLFCSFLLSWRTWMPFNLIQDTYVEKSQSWHKLDETFLILSSPLVKEQNRWNTALCKEALHTSYSEICFLNATTYLENSIDIWRSNRFLLLLNGYSDSAD